MPDQRVTLFLYKGGACCGLVIQNMELFIANRDYQLPGLLARDYEWADHTG